MGANSGLLEDFLINAHAFRHFYDYHFTENRKPWDRYVAHLSHEQFTQAVGYSHEYVRDQIVHLMKVGEVWFNDLRGVEPSESFSPANFDDRNIIRTHWDSVEQRMYDYLAALRDDMLFDKPIAEPEEDKNLPCGKCCSTRRITAPIIAHNCSDCSTIWASGPRRKITSSMPMVMRFQTHSLICAEEGCIWAIDLLDQ